MKLKCPACGAPVSAADINVQQLVAVCPHCDNVFKIDNMLLPQQRKIKAPEQVSMMSDDPSQLDMFFKWSWRTEPPLSMFAITILLITAVLMLIGMIGEGAPLVALMLPLILGSWMSYTLLTLLVNRTHYQSDGDTLRVFTEPLPYFRYGKRNIIIDEIKDVTVERPVYPPFPEGKDGFYNVYVHTFDGDKIRVAAYVNYQHANFITQELKAHLQASKETPPRLTTEHMENETDEISEWQERGDKRLESRR